MSEDWSVDVKKYVPDADDAAIAGIVRHCGIALRNRDASMVSFSDSDETDRVRDSFCKKKLALTDSDSDLDAAIAAIGQRMAGDTTKNRVTVYYLLADHFGKLGLFGGAAAATMAPAAAASAAMPMMAAAVTPDDDDRRDPAGMVVTGAPMRGLFVPLLLLVLGGLLVFSLVSRHHAAAEPEMMAAATAVPVTAAIPEGAGIIANDVAGIPALSVYFDTAKTDVTPEMPAAAAPLLAYVAAHPDTHLAVSGYNDPRGDAAMNAELSKNRAKAVALVLISLGVREANIDLVKPANTTDTTTDYSNARRVDVSVEDEATMAAIAAEAAAEATAEPAAAPAQAPPAQ